MKINATLLLLLFVSAQNLMAQKLPASNIYLFDMQEVADSIFLFSSPKYLTAFNSKGYNNQPSFISDDELYFTVQFLNDTTQTDIYGVNLKDTLLSQITATSLSEYSPQLMPYVMENMPNEPMKPRFSCVRVESAATNIQRLWSFPVDRSDNGVPVARTVENIGYYQWVDPNHVAIFQVSNPFQLGVINIANEYVTNITSNIGRCLQPLPMGNIAFVHKMGSSWLIKGLDPISSRVWLLTATLPGSEDFVASLAGTFFMGKGSKLYKFHKGKDTGWIEIADFSYYGINNITRLALRGNKIAIVNQ